MLEGTIKTYHNGRAFGFIRPDAGDNESQSGFSTVTNPHFVCAGVDCCPGVGVHVYSG
jgi:cold shock CspA family protein